MEATELFTLEYLNDHDMNVGKPTKYQIKEVPFIKNNPRYKTAT